MENTKIISILVTSLVIIGTFSLIFISNPFSTSVKDTNPIEENNGNNNINTQTESENSNDSENHDKTLDYNDGTSQGYGNIVIRVSYPVTTLNGKSMLSIPVPFTRIYLESEDGTLLRIGITNLRGYKVFRFVPMDHDYVIKVHKKNYRNTETFTAMSTDTGFVNIYLT